MGAQFGESLVQAPALDELHRVVVDAVIAPDGVDRDDVPVLELRGGARLVSKALQLASIEKARKGQHLERHASTERDLLRLVHDAHAAAADLPDDAEVADGLRGPRRALVIDAVEPPQELGLRAHVVGDVAVRVEELGDAARVAGRFELEDPVDESSDSLLFLRSRAGRAHGSPSPSPPP